MRLTENEYDVNRMFKKLPQAEPFQVELVLVAKMLRYLKRLTSRMRQRRENRLSIWVTTSGK